MSEASLVVGRTSAWFASLADFFFLLTPIFFSPFPPMQSLGLDSEVGCIFKAPLHLVLVQGVVFTQWYLTCFLLPFLINFLQAYLSGWGGEGVCVCNELGWNRCYAIL